MTSVNGFEWTLHSTNHTGYEALAFAGDKFFAMPDDFAVSSDGTNWIFPTLGGSFYFYDVTFGKSLYVALNYDSRMATSHDGLSWTPHATPAGDLNSVAFGNGRFVAGGYGGEVITSADGTNWTLVASGIEEDIRKVSFLEGRFFAVGGYIGDLGLVWTSADGTTWASHGPDGPTELAGIAYGSGTFVAVGEGTAARSENGVDWSTVFAETDPWLHSITYAQGLQVAVGWTRSNFVSADGVNWRQVSSGTQRNLNSITYANGLFVAVGWSGAILTSTNGTNWTGVTSGTSDSLTGVEYGDGKFVCVNGKYEDARVLVSSNALNWTIYPVGPYTLRNITYGNGMFLIFGDDAALLTSTNGIDWVEQFVPSGRFEYYLDVAWGNGQFILVGTYGRIFKSPDGVNWTGQNMGALYTRGVAFVNGRWLVGTDRGTLFSSPDGSNWTMHESGSSYGLTDFVFAHGAVTALSGLGPIYQSDPWQDSVPAIAIVPRSMILKPGDASSMEVAATGTSPLSYQWFHNGTPIPNATNSVLYFYDLNGADGGEYSTTVSNALGSNTSAPGVLTIRPVLRASWNGTTELTITGTPGRTYRIEYANDLTASWQFLTNVTLSGASKSWSDSSWSGGARFYRAVLLSP